MLFYFPMPLLGGRRGGALHAVAASSQSECSTLVPLGRSRRRAATRGEWVEDGAPARPPVSSDLNGLPSYLKPAIERHAAQPRCPSSHKKRRLSLLVEFDEPELLFKTEPANSPCCDCALHNAYIVQNACPAGSFRSPFHPQRVSESSRTAMSLPKWRICAPQQESSHGEGTAKVEQGSSQAEEGEGEDQCVEPVAERRPTRA